jgi:hypothetical protein
MEQCVGIRLYIALTILLEYWSGYNESKVDNIVRIVRQGFPGKKSLSFIL